MTRKRGNPDYQVSSYYIPKGLNLKFDRAVLALKAAGFETDKSDVLSALISRFVNQVDVAEKAATIEKGIDLKSILDAAGEGSISETAEVSALKTELKAMISTAEKEQAAIAEEQADSRKILQQANETMKVADQDRKEGQLMRDEYRQKFDEMAAQMKKQMDLVQKWIDQEQ